MTPATPATPRVADHRFLSPVFCPRLDEGAWYSSGHLEAVLGITSERLRADCSTLTTRRVKGARYAGQRTRLEVRADERLHAWCIERKIHCKIGTMPATLARWHGEPE